MSTDMNYDAVFARKNAIMKASVGIDYEDFETGDLEKLRRSYIRNCLVETETFNPTTAEINFMAEDTNSSTDFVEQVISELRVSSCEGQM
jgi:hypothetical protein